MTRRRWKGMFKGKPKGPFEYAARHRRAWNQLYQGEIAQRGFQDDDLDGDARAFKGCEDAMNAADELEKLAEVKQ